MRENQLGRRMLVVALCTTLTGCGRESQDSAMARDTGSEARTQSPEVERSAGLRVIGTIAAVLDGRPRTWYVVDGAGKQGRYASATWHTRSNGARLVSVGGFDTQDPPIRSFHYDVERGDISYGDYAGSAIALVFSAPAGGSALSVDLENPDEMASLAYMPTATVDPAGVYTSGSGSIHVTRLTVDGNTATVEGSFEGVLRTVQGVGPLRVEHGRFSVSGVPTLEDLGH